MSRSAFRKFIATLSEEDLRNELQLLYTKIKQVKTHYSMELGETLDRKKIYDKVKKEIYNLFYIRGLPRRRPRIQKIKTLIKELNKNAVFNHETADLYIYASRTGLDYLLLRPNTTKAAFNNCIENFSKGCDLVSAYSLEDDFLESCKSIVLDAKKIYMIKHEIQEIYDMHFGE